MAAPVNFTGLPPVRTTLERAPGSLVGLEGAKAGTPGNVSKPFGQYLAEEIDGVNNLQKEADEAVAAVTTGRSRNLHEMMIALDKADVSFRMLTKVRSKVVDAYQEIMRMPI